MGIETANHLKRCCAWLNSISTKHHWSGKLAKNLNFLCSSSEPKNRFDFFKSPGESSNHYYCLFCEKVIEDGTSFTIILSKNQTSAPRSRLKKILRRNSRGKQLSKFESKLLDCYSGRLQKKIIVQCNFCQKTIATIPRKLPHELKAERRSSITSTARTPLSSPFETPSNNKFAKIDGKSSNEISSRNSTINSSSRKKRLSNLQRLLMKEEQRTSSDSSNNLSSFLQKL